MYTLDDTIAAVATPPGEGGIGVIKISGPEALPILRRLFRRTGRETRLPASVRHRESGGVQVATWSPAPRHLYYGHVMDPDSEETIDEVLAAYMPAPYSYTCQDVVELQAHSGIVALRRILELTLRQGARLAEPGEMTLRAFLNGRLDLAQAEAVLDVVQAQTTASLRVAVEQLGGRLSAEVSAVRRGLVDVLAYLEASIDFVEDEIPYQDIAQPLLDAAEGLRRLLAGAERGLIYRQGLRAAIVGRPNVGKSSLLNLLLRVDRAIVTPIPGTTRDTLEERLDLQGVPIILVDTAGIAAETADIVERLGIERSRRALQRADLALLVMDGSEPLREGDWDLARLLEGKTALLVVNKLDLPQIPIPDAFLPGVQQVALSALTGEGLAGLEAAILNLVWSGKAIASETPLVSSPRHQAALARALDHVSDAHRAYAGGATADLVAIDVRDAVEALGEITGETVSEDLLETIFSKFCVGK
jgi:tRNA modification GTPase